MKGRDEVIDEFNGFVNMTVPELESWLKSPESKGAGWTNGSEGGETVGHDSGRKIVEILKANPDKEPNKYTEDQIAHMRKVVSYCKRHLAQERAADNQKSDDELKETKSYKSLKNWGHDFLKAKDKTGSQSKTSPSSKATNDKQSNKESKQNGAKNGKKQEKEDAEEMEVDGEEEEESSEYEEDEEDEGENEDEEEEEEEEENEGEEESNSKQKVGEKRKQPAKKSNANKKRETAKGTTTRRTRSAGKDDEAEEANDANDAEDNEDDDAEEKTSATDENTNSKKESKQKTDKKSNSEPSSNGPSKGDTVSWKWGSGHPQGKVLDVKDDTATITTKNGNQVSRKGEPGDPAVVLDAGKSKAVKLAHELD